MSQKEKEALPPYLNRTEDVIRCETEHYLKEHRRANGIEEPVSRDNLTGICISGGGIRSATLGLGMIQAFIREGVMKRFDYMSTVSGGGYIGSCLSSLLSKEPEVRTKKNAPDEIRNNNQRFNVSDYGLEEHNSPFTNEEYEYEKAEKARLNARQQLMHLRQHGEYLAPHRSIRDWDLHRLLGAVFGGVVTNVSIFLLVLCTVVVLHHLLLSVMSDGNFMKILREPAPMAKRLQAYEDSLRMAEFRLDSTRWAPLKREMPVPRPAIDTNSYYKQLDNVLSNKETSEVSISGQLSLWVKNQLEPQVYLIWIGVRVNWKLALLFGLAGSFTAFFFLWWAHSIPFKVIKQEQDEQNMQEGNPDAGRIYERKPEQDMLDLLENPLIRSYFITGLMAVPFAAYVATACMTRMTPDFNFFVMLALPLCFSLGLYITLHPVNLYFINSHNHEKVSGWLYRSFYSGMQGGALLMILVTVIFPLAIVLLFGEHGIALKLSFSLLPVAVAYYFTIQSFADRKGMISGAMKRLQNPLLNMTIFLFAGLAFAWVSVGVLNLEEWLYLKLPCLESIFPGNERTALLFFLFLGGTLLLIYLGFVVNANDTSLHYFYRDRLSEAYLRTIGKVSSPVTSSAGRNSLQRVTMRNHEDIRLADLGEGSYKAPYHLLLTALNMQGSHDLSAKTLKSEHFIFSRFYIGSRSTGYASTRDYHYGSAKLSTAMAISAAAVSSGMGPLGFAASNFYMTLFNFRTGYWIDNPKSFFERRQLNEQLARETTGFNWRLKIKKLWSNWCYHNPFWLYYIGKELTGRLGTNSHRIYVSDGGHTGDNLGLLPLIQRQCCTIVVADFEEDGEFSFDSFNQAVRLAKSVYNADISIDLTRLIPVEGSHGTCYSPSSVAVGTITYNDVIRTADGGTRVSIKKGQLIYMKSSIGSPEAMREVFSEENTPGQRGADNAAPVFVLNYHKKNPHFPHHSTTDQFFDEVQFEAYRMLGEHIGKQAAPKIRFEPLRETA